jgi:hypothetical protein
MSVANIKKAFKNGLLKELQKDARDKSSMTHAHLVAIDSTLFAVGMENGINKAAKAQGFTEVVADFDTVKKHTQKVQDNWIRGKHGLKGVQATFRKGRLVVYRKALSNDSSSTYARKVNQAFRKQVFELWKKDTGIGANWDSNTAKIVGKETPFSHNDTTNVANAGLVQWIEETSDEIVPANSSLTRSNVAEMVLEAMGIDWAQTVDPVTGKLIWVITGDLTAKRFNPKAGEEDLTKEWEERLLKKFDEILAGKAGEKFKDPSFVASKPFDEAVAETTVRKIAKKYKKVAGVKITGLPKKPKKTKRSGSAKKGRKSTKSKTVDTKLAAKASMARAERGTSAATEEGAVELARLKKYIQGRLPAEVRRNMGRPALMNRTGRFSNSVQLVDLVEGRGTILARYTYLLSPYETFENTGRRKWPVAYNPKTLIAKSIRNLAEGRIAQKLTVRRV